MQGDAALIGSRGAEGERGDNRNQQSGVRTGENHLGWGGMALERTHRYAGEKGGRNMQETDEELVRRIHTEALVRDGPLKRFTPEF
jgi:hypothetical protein